MLPLLPSMERQKAPLVLPQLIPLLERAYIMEINTGNYLKPRSQCLGAIDRSPFESYCRTWSFPSCSVCFSFFIFNIARYAVPNRCRDVVESWTPVGSGTRGSRSKHRVVALNMLHLIFTRPAGRIYLSTFTLFTPLFTGIVTFSFTACIARGLIGDPYHSRRCPSPNLYSGASTGVARVD